MNFDMKDVAGLEARNIAYSEDGQGNDLMLVKEYVHLKDGRVVPNIRFRKNYMRKFYVAKTGTRNYKEKKQWESKENVIEFQTNQANLAAAAHKAVPPWCWSRSRRWRPWAPTGRWPGRPAARHQW